ncbi:MAG: hypothetical protein ACON4P_08365, partial [Candidatus Puniceispirillales bacterium]
MLSRLQINPLSLRLMLVMVGLFGFAGSVVLLFNLPGYHQKEVERRMRELVFIAELNAMESQLERPLTPIEPGCGIGITLAAGETRWFGDPEARLSVTGSTPRPWQDSLLFQARIAALGLLGLDEGFTFYQVRAVQLADQGVHSRLNTIGDLVMVFPADAMTAPMRDYLLRGMALVIGLALLIGVPFALIIEWLVIFPLRRLITDMAAFARDPYRQRQDDLILTSQDIINEARDALDTMTTATRNELVQRDKLAALGEAVTKINHDMRNVLASAVLLSDSLENSEDPKVARA